ncbi:DNA adenine methylase [Sulfobacillus harzensis]|uniref:DNA adenine methylase n=1 Tax=Sulfobacillus harzensis TaxID=2729629 RepID=UPI0030845D43
MYCPVDVPQAALSPIKWAGGKRQLLPQLLAAQPSSWNRYLEPFAGGAALFFALRAPGAYLSDTNPELINMYRVIRDDVESLIAHLRRHRNEAEYFYAVRALNPESLTPTERASRLIFLNKTCFNGLFRVNSKGKFNVPFGRYQNPVIVNPDRLRAAHRVLQTAEIVEADYSAVLDVAQPHDFVYVDPPYVPVSTTANFTSYTADGFNWSDQVQLANMVRQLAQRRCYVMASNADVPAIHNLYRGMWIQVVPVRRAINSDATKRSGATEVIITTYPVEGAHRS